MNHFMETSAKDGSSAREILIEAAKILYDEAQKYQQIKTDIKGKDTKSKLILGKSFLETEKKGRCCHS